MEKFNNNRLHQINKIISWLVAINLFGVIVALALFVLLGVSPPMAMVPFNEGVVEAVGKQTDVVGLHEVSQELAKKLEFALLSVTVLFRILILFAFAFLFISVLSIFVLWKVRKKIIGIHE